MADYFEIKRLAMEVNAAFPDKEDLWNMVCTPSVALHLVADIERLKAENEALLKALDVASARILAAKVCFDRDYPGEWSGELHLAVAIKEIDAAMGQGEQS